MDDARLVFRGRSLRIVRQGDRFVVERLTKDALGGSRWTAECSVRRDRFSALFPVLEELDDVLNSVEGKE